MPGIALSWSALAVLMSKRFVLAAVEGEGLAGFAWAAWAGDIMAVDKKRAAAARMMRERKGLNMKIDSRIANSMRRKE